LQLSVVLASTTTLDLFLDDYSLYDNAGGVAVIFSGSAISSVPERSTFLPLGIALLGRNC
jgi:hypothetical protein